MSETRDAGGTTWDAPNQQVVRDDASPPWQEGTGGDTGEPVAGSQADGYDLRSHAGLDALAADQGHEWSAEGLTVAEKRDELGV